MNKKVFAILAAFLVAGMAMAMAANVKTVDQKDGAILYSEANEWTVYVPEAGTVTVKDNKKSFSFEFDKEGTYSLGLQKGYTGQLSLVGFELVPVIEEPVVVNLGFIGYYLFDDNVLSTSFYWQGLNEGDLIDWVAVDAAYDEWVAKGGLAPAREFWQTSGYASFTFDDYAEIGFNDFNIGQLENYYKAYFVDPGYKQEAQKVTVTFVDPFEYELVRDVEVEVGTEFGWNDTFFPYADWEWETAWAYWLAEFGIEPGWNVDHLWVNVDDPDDYYTYPEFAELFPFAKTEITEDVTLTLVPSGSDDDCDSECEEEAVFESANVKSFNKNLQNGNNNNLTFTVTVTMSDGSTYDVKHAEKVSGGQKGSKTFDYGAYKVNAAWNDNNTVTSVVVL